MKASIWGLLVAAIAFGASTIYLSVQLTEERAQAEKLAEATRALNARIAELEKAGDQRLTVHGMFSDDTVVQNVMPAPPPPRAEKGETRAERVEPFTVAGPPRTEAFQKMMRSQMRANNKRIYADVGAQLGLSREDASKLIDMLTDQQVESFGRMRELPADPADPAERRRAQEETNRENQAELENFLGASKTAALREYQETIPARQEMEAVARQLEGADATLNDEQQKRLLTAFVDERKRIPMPKMADFTTPEEYTKAYSEWQSDYNERVSSQARTILNTDQMTTYSEYQQWQKEMREQVAVRRQGRGTRGGPMGNVEFAVATPIAGEAMMLTAPAERPRDGQ